MKVYSFKFSEGTKIGCVDEADINLALSKTILNTLKEHLEFNDDLQSIEVKENSTDGIPDELKEYQPYLRPYRPFIEVGLDHMGLPSQESLRVEVDPMGIPLGHYQFDVKKYFLNFISLIHEVVSNPKFSSEGVTLTTDYIPCEICKNTDQVEAMNVRCKHEQECKEKDHCENECSCNCQVYNSPCLTHSKVGAVLHLQFDADKCNIYQIQMVRLYT